MTSPETWLAGFETKIADLQQKAAQFQQGLEHSSATETSRDGRITVTVAPNGSLTDLRIDDAALTRTSGAQLAAEILRTARRAQRTAAAKVAEAFTPLGGPDNEALRMVTGFLPPEDPAPSQPGTPAPATSPQQTRPAPRPQRRATDEDEGGAGFMREDAW